LNEQVMGKFLEKLMGAPEKKPLPSNEHFSVDGTLLQTCASHSCLERIDGQDDPPPPPSGPGEGFEQPKVRRKRAKAHTHRPSRKPVITAADQSISTFTPRSSHWVVALTCCSVFWPAWIQGLCQPAALALCICSTIWPGQNN
jgi:hypothetical protein